MKNNATELVLQKRSDEYYSKDRFKKISLRYGTPFLLFY